MYDPIALQLPESIEFGDHIVATYLYQTRANVDIERLAVALSEEQSSGTWVKLAHESDEVRRRHVGKVVAIWEVPDHETSVPDEAQTRSWVLQIGYPVHNFGGQIPLMLTTVHGNIAAAGRLKLVDLHFPAAYVAQFKGPKFGVAGIRRLLGVPDRPLLHTMIKPSIGLTPEESAEAYYQAALGGVDMVPQLFADMGRDFMVGAGGAVHGHPQGARAGACALRQAIDATLQGMPLAHAAAQHAELAAALRLWGMADGHATTAYDLMQG